MLPEPAYTCKMLADHYGCKIHYIRWIYRRGLLPMPQKVGHIWMIPISHVPWIEIFLNENRIIRTEWTRPIPGESLPEPFDIRNYEAAKASRVGRALAQRDGRRTLSPCPPAQSKGLPAANGEPQLESDGAPAALQPPGSPDTNLLRRPV